MKNVFKILFLIMLGLVLCGCSQCCIEEEYSTYQPVEVLYRKTTYKTVYIPTTYKQISYERKPYNKCDKEMLCK